MAEHEFETRLKDAFRPVDPPRELGPRVERTLSDLVEIAADELEGWERSAIRDPRNWPRRVARVAAATAIGSLATGSLVLLSGRRSAGASGPAVKALRRVVRVVRRAGD